MKTIFAAATIFALWALAYTPTAGDASAAGLQNIGIGGSAAGLVHQIAEKPSMHERTPNTGPAPQLQQKIIECRRARRRCADDCRQAEQAGRTCNYTGCMAGHGCG